MLILIMFILFYRVVSHEHIYKPDYLTISLKGVTRMRSDDETEFELLDRWEQEVIYFQKLIKVTCCISSLFLLYQGCISSLFLLYQGCISSLFLLYQGNLLY